MVDFEKIMELRKQINDLIKEKPYLLDFQLRIDCELSKAGPNVNNRSAALNAIAVELQQKLAEACRTLADETRKLVKMIESDEIKKD